MNKNTIKAGLLLLVILFTASACNNKDILHKCAVFIEYDWTATVYPEGTDNVRFGIYGPDGRQVDTQTGIDGTYLEDITDGTYDLLVTEDSENIAYEDFEVSVSVDPSGKISEPGGHFSAGEKQVVIKGMEVVGSEAAVTMAQQSRTLIVRFLVMDNEIAKFNTISGFTGSMSDVTVARDISQGFPPAQTSRSPLEATRYGDFDMTFRRIMPEAGSGAVATFESKQRILGLDPGRTHIFKFSYLPGDAVGIVPLFLEFDPLSKDSQALKDFHTRTNVNDSYIFTIKVGTNSVDGSIEIEGWDIDTEDEDLTANED